MKVLSLKQNRSESVALDYERVKDNTFIKMIRIAVYVLIRFFFISYHGFRRFGRAPFNSSKGIIFAANHSSHLDTLAIFCGVPIFRINSIRAVAARDYFFKNRRLLALSHLLANVIPFDRSHFDEESLELCSKELSKGNSLIFYPEGTRSITGEIARFHSGVSVLSHRAKVPIVPVCLNGTYASLPKNNYVPKSERITVYFGKPMMAYVNPLKENPYRDFTDNLREAIILIRRRL